MHPKTRYVFTASLDVDPASEDLLSDAWAKAVDQGRWPKEIRLHIRARRHTLKKVMR